MPQEWGHKSTLIFPRQHGVQAQRTVPDDLGAVSLRITTAVLHKHHRGPLAGTAALSSAEMVHRVRFPRCRKQVEWLDRVVLLTRLDASLCARGQVYYPCDSIEIVQADSLRYSTCPDS